MVGNLETLLGNEHSDPTCFEVKSILPTVAIGISSVVDKYQKTHNLVNNEDATAIYCDDELLISMVADAHDGYVASHQAVEVFPRLLKEQGIGAYSSSQQVMQGYLNAFLELYVQLLNIRRRSGVIYERPEHGPRADFSSTTFHSILSVGGNYYSIGAGDSSTAIIRNDQLLLVRPACPHFIGYVDLRYKIKEKTFCYNEKAREIQDAFDIRRSALSRNDLMGEQGRKLFEEEAAALDNLSTDFSIAPLPSMNYTDDHVRAVIPVHRLDVLPGDVLFQCTDGLKLDSPFPIRKDPVSYLVHLFKDPTVPVYDALTTLFQDIERRQVAIEWDNVAVCARRIL